ncbi:YvrJ family protein [Paenibacillus sp. P26]|nr:YvrJ family protein [Paenibacillus sp. P26]UUZ90988.1 YvrJ family protein [Paenibacillus sp. P25]
MDSYSLDAGQMIGLITDIGFPIAVTMFLLLNVQKRLDRLDQTITELIKKIQDLK